MAAAASPLSRTSSLPEQVGASPVLIVDGEPFDSMDKYFPGLKSLPEHHEQITEVNELFRCTNITDAVFPLIWDKLDDLQMDREDVKSAARLIRLNDPWEYDPDLRFFIFHERSCIVHAVQRDSRIASIIYSGEYDLTRAGELNHLKSALTRLERGQKVIESALLHVDFVDTHAHSELVRKLIRNDKSTMCAIELIWPLEKPMQPIKKPVEVKIDLVEPSINLPVLVVTLLRPQIKVVKTSNVLEYFLKPHSKTRVKRNGDELRKLLQDQPEQLEQLDSLLTSIKEAVELARYPNLKKYTQEIYSFFAGNGRAVALHHKYMEIHDKAQQLLASTAPDQKSFIDRILQNAASNIADSPFAVSQGISISKRTQDMLSDRGVVLLMYPHIYSTIYIVYRVETKQYAVFSDHHECAVRTRIHQLDCLSIAWLRLKRGKNIKTFTKQNLGTPEEIAEGLRASKEPGVSSLLKQHRP